MKLSEQKCVACEGNTAPFVREESEVLIKQVPTWVLADDAKSITKKYVFKDFKEALAFINIIGEIAESEGHHPNIHLTNYNNVEITLSTHAAKGLTNNDFIMAAKIDEHRA